MSNTENDSAEQGGGVGQTLPHLLYKVLSGNSAASRCGGWDVRRLASGEVQINIYDEPPETGDELKTVASLPSKYVGPSGGQDE